MLIIIYQYFHFNKKRLILTLGSDLRGRTSADAAFHLALSGADHTALIFDALVDIAIHELDRIGHRSSFQPKHLLQMIEKFAACDITNSDLFQQSAVLLEAKGHTDEILIESLKNGEFGLHSDRPLLWLWRFSSRQKKIKVSASGQKHDIFGSNFSWGHYFHDTSKSIVVDIGSGCGASLLNLSRINQNEGFVRNQRDLPNMDWADCNFVGADLNHQLVSYANGIVSRSSSNYHRNNARVHFFCCAAMVLLEALHSYPGKIELILIQFPSPYRLVSKEPHSRGGNSQLPSTDGYMITPELVQAISKMLEKDNGQLLVQTKCEDVAVYTKNLIVEENGLECLPASWPVRNIDDIYNRTRPKRVDDWLQYSPDAERAEGEVWSSRPILPSLGRTETEVQCDFERSHIHRCIISYKAS